jgi:hypothetical protein
MHLPPISDKFEHKAKLRFVSYSTEEKLPKNIRFMFDSRHGARTSSWTKAKGLVPPLIEHGSVANLCGSDEGQMSHKRQ